MNEIDHAANDAGIEAHYFDGQSSLARPVRLNIEQQQLRIDGHDFHLHRPIASLRISEPFAQTPRRIDLADAGHCEIVESAELRQWLPQLGYRPTLAARWLAHWPATLAALGALLLILWLAFSWGLPWLAKQLAPHIPPSFTERLSQQALTTLDQSILRPSALSAQRQNAIGARFNTLLNANDPKHRLLFRSIPRQANAFALPDGTLVLSDELVALAGNDDEVVAVLAHELGHIAERHGLRQVIQSSALGIAAGLYFGDVSSLAGGLVALAGSASYSRDFEIAADRFAAQRLQRNGLSPKLLARLLAKLDQQHDAPPATPRALRTHPDSSERIALLRSYR